MINRAYQEHYGVSQDDAYGSAGREWLSEESVEKLRENDLKVLSTGRPVETEFDRIDGGGKRVLMQSIKFPVRDATGSIVGIGGISSDISAQRLAEEALTRQSALLQTTLDHMVEGISVFDAELRLVAFNRVFIDLYEFPEELIRAGITFAEFIRHLAEGGHYGDGEIDEIVRTRVEKGARESFGNMSGPVATARSSGSDANPCRKAASSLPIRTSPRASRPRTHCNSLRRAPRQRTSQNRRFSQI